MGKLVSIIKKGYYGNVVTVMFREKEIVRFYRSQTGEGFSCLARSSGIGLSRSDIC